VLALALAASVARADDRRVAWNRPAEPFRILDNVWYVGTAGLGAYLITSPGGHILVDGALEESAPQIEASIAKLGFRLADVKLLVNTHAHFDHAGGLARIKKDTGAKLVASAGDRPLLEGGFYPGAESEGSFAFPKVAVDRVIKDGERVSAGAASLTAHLTPGHTPGCTSWSATVRDGGVERSVLIFCSATVAANRLVGKPSYPGIVEAYRHTFAIARTLAADVFLAPHPEMFDLAAKRAKQKPGAPNPFVVPGEFAAYVGALEKDFAAELRRQSAAE
jgi:metallo-beta-lactamase class B